MQTNKVHDIIGIGIGPFNLGLAALAHSVPGLNCLFLDKNKSFEWHPGLMLEGARLQVPFLADLVTLADPSSKFSYLCFLKAKNRLTRFAIHENYYPTRKEYNQYCQWVATQLPSLQFGKTCTAITHNVQTNFYNVVTRNNDTGEFELFHGKHIVVGTGTVPFMPACAQTGTWPLVFHSGEYLFKQDILKCINDITIIGSGQSAAEIFHHLLTSRTDLKKLSWFTRSARFFPMEYSKLSLEMSSPDYIDYFFGLTTEQKKKVLAGQDQLYKGINFSLINEIYDLLYMRSLDENAMLPHIATSSELTSIEKNPDGFKLEIMHKETGKAFTHQTGAVILATGYRQQVPAFLGGIKKLILWKEDGYYDVQQNYSIDRANTVFAQNGDLHTHGFNSADLGLGAYRNAVMLNHILQGARFSIEKETGFQYFNRS